MSELQIMRCARCDHAVFPDRLLCPRCGGAELHHVPAGPGTLQETTTVRRPAPPEGDLTTIGSVRLDAGPVLVVRVGSRATTGARVTIDRDAAGVIWAHEP